MIVKTIAQPETQLGLQIDELLDSGIRFTRIIFVSAFTALRTILRLRDRLLRAAERGSVIRIIVGIDLGGTSREVLEELARWNCEVFVYHNPLPHATFHPKIYLFESYGPVVLIIGSNNLTDGGLYTNYEAATRYDLNLPEDEEEYRRILNPLAGFIEPTGQTVQPLTVDLIQILSERGLLPTEIDARRSRRERQRQSQEGRTEVPRNPFTAVNVPRAPILHPKLRELLPRAQVAESSEQQESPLIRRPRPEGILVWRKKLPRTDALQTRPGSHHVGGVRLTQANFEDQSGKRIDQTTYFRRLFDDYDWEPESARHADQEHAFIPMRIIIGGEDFGIRNFEISHKPSGESGQANYTTILRWGREFNNVVISQNLTGKVFSLYETPEEEAQFLIEITYE